MARKARAEVEGGLYHLIVILCQSDRYLAELVRYIHLNPVRAKMVRQPEQYPYSSHRAYLGLEAAGIVDVEPVLRHFGAKKKVAREAYRQFVAAGMKSGHQDRFYLADEGRILGTEEFVDATIHRLGESQRSGPVKLAKEFNPSQPRIENPKNRCYGQIASQACHGYTGKRTTSPW